jgi:hypothetical protein
MTVQPDEAPWTDKPKRRVQREWQAQRADNAFLSRALPPEAYYTAIDVGRSKSAQEGMLRKRRGVKPGIADFIVIWNSITLWIERKAGSSMSEHQRMFREAVTRNGHHYRLARSTEEVEEACRSVGIPLRASVLAIRARIEAQNEGLKGPRAGKLPARLEKLVSPSRVRRAHAAGVWKVPK